MPQARDMVNQLYNHPAIVLWCFGAQPGLRNFEKVGMAMAAAARREDPYRFVQQGASVWEWKLIKDKYDWPIDYHFFCGWFSPEFNHASSPARGAGIAARGVRVRRLGGGTEDQAQGAPGVRQRVWRGGLAAGVGLAAQVHRRGRPMAGELEGLHAPGAARRPPAQVDRRRPPAWSR